MKAYKNLSIYQYKGQEKKDLIETLERLKTNLREQNQQLFNLFLIHNEDLIKTIELFLRGKIGIFQLQKTKESRLKRNKETLNIIKRGLRKC